MTIKNFALCCSVLLSFSFCGPTALSVLAKQANSSSTGSENSSSGGAKAGSIQPEKSSDETSVASKMERLLQFYSAKKQFMGSVIVAKDHDVLLDKGYGFANLEWDLPNSPDTKFRLASVSKQFTAAAVLLLEQQGKLKLNDSISKYLTDAPAAWSKITIFHLLTHSSGMPTYDRFADYNSFKKKNSSSADLMKRIRDKPLEFEPGKKFSYSNSGYLALGLLIERVSGKKYGQFVIDNFFKPLAMNDSGYGSVAAIIKHRASGYLVTARGLQNADFNDWSNSFAAGGLYSTVEDMLRWENGLFAGKVLSAASLAKMTTAFKQDYGLGLDVRNENGRKVIGHTGSIDGFDNVVAYYPDDKLSVIVLSNVSGSTSAELAAKLAAIVHGDKNALPLARF